MELFLVVKVLTILLEAVVAKAEQVEIVTYLAVAALEAGAEAKALNCSHIFADGAVRPA